MARTYHGTDYTPQDHIAKVTGRARYAEDWRAEGMLFAKSLLSPMPHARVRSIDASEAQAIGLVNRVYADTETMLSEVTAIAREIASKAPLAVYGCKRMINYARDHSTADGLDYIGIWNASMLQPEEMLEAMTANAEKRSGDFVDLPPIKRSTSGDMF